MPAETLLFAVQYAVCVKFTLISTYEFEDNWMLHIHIKNLSCKYVCSSLALPGISETSDHLCDVQFRNSFYRTAPELKSHSNTTIQVPTALMINIQVFWDMTPCRLTNRNRRFGKLVASKLRVAQGKDVVFILCRYYFKSWNAVCSKKESLISLLHWLTFLDATCVISNAGSSTCFSLSRVRHSPQYDILIPVTSILMPVAPLHVTTNEQDIRSDKIQGKLQTAGSVRNGASWAVTWRVSLNLEITDAFIWLYVLWIREIWNDLKWNDTEINNKIITNGTQLPAEDDPT